MDLLPCQPNADSNGTLKFTKLFGFKKESCLPVHFLLPTALQCGTENHFKKPPAGGRDSHWEDNNQLYMLIVRLTAQWGRLDEGKEQIKYVKEDLGCRALGHV